MSSQEDVDPMVDERDPRAGVEQDWVIEVRFRYKSVELEQWEIEPRTILVIPSWLAPTGKISPVDELGEGADLCEESTLDNQIHDNSCNFEWKY